MQKPERKDDLNLEFNPGALGALPPVKAIRCQCCRLRGTEERPMRRLVHPVEGSGRYEDLTVDDGFCDRGRV